MYIARITASRETVERIDDYETGCANGKVVRRPRVARAWRFYRKRRGVVVCEGAAAISGSPEGAVASARKMLEEPEFEFAYQPKRERV